jgi:hypothetical protein
MNPFKLKAIEQMCELILTEKARNVGIENDCCSVYTAIGPEGIE